jgi:hypothetical protein
MLANSFSPANRPTIEREEVLPDKTAE